MMPLPITASSVINGAAFSAFRVSARTAAMIAASSGKSGISHKRGSFTASALQLVDLADRYASKPAIDIQNDRQPDRRLRSRDRDSDQHENLRFHGGRREVAPERKEVQIRRIQHQLHAHDDRDG